MQTLSGCQKLRLKITSSESFTNTFPSNNETKRPQSQPEKKNIAILDAAFESGFKSKSTFNKVFKELTGETPTNYRNNM